MAKAKVENPHKLVLGKHRVSYVHLKEPAQFEGEGDAKYSVTFLIPKNHPDVAKIKAAIKSMYEANKGGHFKGVPATSKNLWNPLRDGDEYMEEKPEAVEYEGMYFLKAASKTQPPAFDSEKQDLLDLDTIYSGCYCRGVIAGYAFSTKKKGYGFGLNSVMFIEDGERLAGFTATADDYDDESEEIDDLN